MWKNISEKEKAPYLKENEKLKEIEQQQKDELAKKGYYTLQDGTKSTDSENEEILKFKKKPAVPSEDEQPKKMSVLKKKAKKPKAGTKGSNGMDLDSETN